MKENNNWYTPRRFIDAVTAVLGKIDLDPASCEFANQIVCASRFFTERDNGLAQPWVCEDGTPASCFCNPPYGKTHRGASNLEFFVKKMRAEYQLGNVREGILLIPVNTATSWFPPLWDYPICFPDFRIRFYTEKGLSDGASFGSIFVYFGTNDARFIEVFSKFGRIAKAIDSPKAKPTMRDLWTRDEVAS